MSDDCGAFVFFFFFYFSSDSKFFWVSRGFRSMFDKPITRSFRKYEYQFFMWCFRLECSPQKVVSAYQSLQCSPTVGQLHYRGERYLYSPETRRLQYQVDTEGAICASLGV